ncbi:acylphosphatase [Clostridium carnis]
MIRYYLIVYGRVQGVGFRYFCQLNAANLNLTGFAHNMIDGSVEIEVQGTDININKFISTIKKGNFFIRVTDLSIKELNVVANEKTFKVL